MISSTRSPVVLGTIAVVTIISAIMPPALTAQAHDPVAINIPSIPNTKPTPVETALNFALTPPAPTTNTTNLALFPTLTPVAASSESGASDAIDPDRIARIPPDWWSQGSDSPIAVALGAAEGTRNPDGSKHPAYYWHTDPGNAANNFGTFSWQHLSSEQMQPVVAATTGAAKRETSKQLGLAETADQAAFTRIKGFESQLRSQAAAKSMTLSFVELVNGLDLANQSPQAALSPMGYLDRLAQMHRELADPTEQILEARVWSFWHPSYNRWDAPGLGNTYTTIRSDQARRMGAIEAALAQYPSD